MNKPVFLVLLFGLSSFAMARTAFAHAELVTAEPAADATVRPAPTELDLTFSDLIEVKFTGVTLIGPDQNSVKTGTETLKDDGRTFTVVLPAALAAGAYKVHWHTLSADGHKTTGDYTFNVEP